MKPSLALLACVALVMVACTGDSSPSGGPTKAQWLQRLDEPDTPNGPDRVTELADGGVEVRAGANVTVWQPEHKATGAYRLAVQVTQTNEGEHPHGAGLVFGGRDLLGDKQVYTYFIVRGDGCLMIKVRNADATEIVAEWTEHSALHRENAESRASNELAVEVGKQTTRFLANGKEVHRAPTAKLHTDGLYGGRVVHEQHVRFEKFHLEPLNQ